VGLDGGKKLVPGPAGNKSNRGESIAGKAVKLGLNWVCFGLNWL